QGSVVLCSLIRNFGSLLRYLFSGFQCGRCSHVVFPHLLYNRKPRLPDCSWLLVTIASLADMLLM
ncbi:hypothetical protein L9F63_013037, partial [Diploptera punctata]